MHKVDYLDKGLEQINFENFENKLLKPLKGILNSFLGGRGEIIFELYDKKHFAFSPENNRTYIPRYWLEEFIKNQDNSEYYSFEFTKEFLFFAIFHEASHYRDMLLELELEAKKSMLSTLERISDEKIDISTDKYIPIGENIHNLYNCIDDTVVNSEVDAFYIGVSKEEIIKIYKEILFSSFEKKDGGRFIKNENAETIYVGEGKGDLEIISDGDIDYRNIQLSNQFPYAILRGKILDDQAILLDDKVKGLFFKDDYENEFLFGDDNRFYRKNIKESFESIKFDMIYYLEKAKNTSDESILDRVGQIESSYLDHIDDLDSILGNFKDIENIIFELIKKSGTKKVNKNSATLIDLIKFFSYGDGYGDDHSLKISPSLRYSIVEKVFQPIQKGFIFMDLLKEDLKDNGKEGKKGKKGKKQNGGFHSHTLHEGDSLEGKIKDLNGIVKSQEIQENAKRSALEALKGKKEVAQKIKEKELKSKGIENPTLALEIYDHIISNNTELISSLVSFIKDQLINIDRELILEEYISKKGKLNYSHLLKEISKDFTGSNISKANFYTRKDIIEMLKEIFRSLDFYMLLDISGSVDVFKGKDGMLTIISTVLYNVMKQIEQVLQKETEDYDYKVPVNFLLYGDGDVYSTFGKDLDDEEIVLDMIDKSIRLSGGTDDRTGWNRIAEYFGENQLKDEDYLNSIKSGKIIPYVMQIADSDVSENGVYSLREVFDSNLGKDISEAIPIKRTILGEKTEEKISEEDFLKIKENGLKGGNWDFKSIDGKIIKQSIGIISEKEIEKQLKNIFDGFLLEIFAIDNSK